MDTTIDGQLLRCPFLPPPRKQTWVGTFIMYPQLLGYKPQLMHAREPITRWQLRLSILQPRGRMNIFLLLLGHTYTLAWIACYQLGDRPGPDLSNVIWVGCNRYGQHDRWCERGSLARILPTVNSNSLITFTVKWIMYIWKGFINICGYTDSVYVKVAPVYVLHFVFSGLWIRVLFCFADFAYLIIVDSDMVSANLR